MRAREAAADGARQIFVLGGDGTFQVLLNAIELPSHVQLGILPAGGGNDLAASLGLPADPVESASLLMNGVSTFLDVAQASTADGSKRLYAGGGGVGLDAEAARYAGGALRHLRGRSRYLLAAIRALIGFRSIRVRVQFEPGGGELRANVLVLGVLNTPSYGAGLRLAPAARPDDGCLDLVALEDLTRPEIVAALRSLVATGELGTTRRVRRFPIRWVRIETDRACLFHGDGEILGPAPVEISVLPRAVRVLRPAVARVR